MYYSFHSSHIIDIEYSLFLSYSILSFVLSIRPLDLGWLPSQPVLTLWLLQRPTLTHYSQCSEVGEMGQQIQALLRHMIDDGLCTGQFLIQISIRMCHQRDGGQGCAVGVVEEEVKGVEVGEGMREMVMEVVGGVEAWGDIVREHEVHHYHQSMRGRERERMC